MHGHARCSSLTILNFGTSITQESKSTSKWDILKSSWPGAEIKGQIWAVITNLENYFIASGLQKKTIRKLISNNAHIIYTWPFNEGDSEYINIRVDLHVYILKEDIKTYNEKQLFICLKVPNPYLSCNSRTHLELMRGTLA